MRDVIRAPVRGRWHPSAYGKGRARVVPAISGPGSLSAVTPRLKAGQRVIGAFGLVSSASLLSGCFYLNPAQTTVSYDGSSGTNVSVGSLKLSAVAISTTAKGARGAMQGMVANPSASPVMLSIAVGGSTTQLTIPADTALRLDGKTSGNSSKTVSPVIIANTPVIPGGKASVVFTTSATGATPVQVPVLSSQYPNQ